MQPCDDGEDGHDGTSHGALVAGARTVEINLEPTQGARLFDEGVYGPATEAVPAFFRDLQT